MVNSQWGKCRPFNPTARQVVLQKENAHEQHGSINRG